MTTSYENILSRRLAALSSEHAFEYLTTLAGEIGVRVAGTPSSERAAQWMADSLSQSGYSPTMERFPQPVWSEQSTVFTLETGELIPAISACFGGTGSIAGKVIPVGNPFTPQDLEGLDLTGCIALVDDRDVYFDYPDNRQTGLLIGAGAVGLVYVAGENQQGGLPYAYHNYRSWFGQGTPLTIIISYKDCQRLKALAPLQAEISVKASVEWSESMNVIAALPGRTHPDELIIVGAHQDAAPTSPGATDDGAGCAIVLELANAFMKTGTPERTVIFILYGGHETGIHGSENWLLRRLNKIQQIKACLNYDLYGMIEGTDRIAVLGSDSWLEYIQRTVAPFQRPVTVSISPGGYDSMNYAALGIPSLNFGRVGAIRNHTSADSLEGTGPAGLETGLLYGAGVLSGLADDPQPLNIPPTPWGLLCQTREYSALWGWGIV